MRKLVTIVLLAGVLAVLAGCSSGNDEEGGRTSGGSEPATRAGAVEDASGEAGGDDSGGGSDPRSQLIGGSVPQVGPQVVKTASLRISVKRGEFDGAIDEAGSIAAGLGGFVVSSSASQGSEKRLVRGTIVVRVPARSYDDAVESLRGLGKVEARNESGQDVSQEYVDLEARIRHLQAVEAQLLELLGRANSVGAALAVQRQLSHIQLDLEQARGRLQYLDDRIAFATISLEIHEEIVGAPKPREDDGFGIVEAWKKAGAGFLSVIGWTFVVLATAAPIVVLLAIAFLLGRLALKRFSWASRRPA
jgi:Domain of unknown function (DUF4349)